MDPARTPAARATGYRPDKPSQLVASVSGSSACIGFPKDHWSKIHSNDRSSAPPSAGTEPQETGERLLG
jgi:hypothetical protein